MGLSKEKLSERFHKKLKFTPTPCQSALFDEIAAFLTEKDDDIMVVNGYAGTGKTSAISAVISVMLSQGRNCVLMAPTGRAAKVLSLYSGQSASTIHKGIYIQKSTTANGFGSFVLSPKATPDTLYFVDEVSLIGIDSGNSGLNFGTGNLLEDLVSYVRMAPGCKLIMIGDSAQLPPVGLDQSPALSREYMIFAGGVVFSNLETVVRQAKESGILHNATILRKLITESHRETFTPDEIGMDVEGYDDIQRITGGELIDALTEAYSKYGEDDTIVLCRSNKRANRYNAGIRAQVLFREERLVKDEKLMIVKNCYQFLDKVKNMEYIANGDIARLQKIGSFEDRYGLHFAQATLTFPDYDDVRIRAKVCLDTLQSEAPSLTYEQQNALYQGVFADYESIPSKKKRYDAVREDPYYNALQLKYADAITCHKSQGGQWKCVFIDNPFWMDELSFDDLKWLYTALTRGIEKVYLVNFRDEYFNTSNKNVSSLD